MKDKYLYIRFEKLSDLKKKINDAMSGKKKYIQGKDEVYFDSLKGFRSFFTIQKYEIIKFVKNEEPNSLYEMAKELDRPYPSLLRDVDSLVATGFLKYEKRTDDERPIKKPVMAFDYKAVCVVFPNDREDYYPISMSA